MTDVESLPFFQSVDTNMRRGLPMVLACSVLAVAGLARFSCDATDKHGDGPAPRSHHAPRVARTGFASITGTVADERGVLGDARVCAVPESDVPTPSPADPICSLSDQQGVYALPRLAAGRYAVIAGAEGHSPQTTEPFDLRDAEARRGVDLRLDVGGALVTGTVVDISGGPIGHAHISVSAGPPVDTDDSGRFRVWTTPGEVSIGATAEGYVSQLVVGESPWSVEIELVPSSSISGTVVDARTRMPIASAKVKLALSGKQPDDDLSDVSDDSGHFLIDGLAPGRYAAVAYAAHGYGQSGGSIEVGLAAHVEGTALLVFPAFAIEGTVVVGTSPSSCQRASLSIRSRSLPVFADDVPGPSGSVRVNSLPPGTYQVWASCDEPEGEGSGSTIEITDHDVTGQIWSLPEGEITTIRELTTISGRVLSASGAPVGGARVTVASDRGKAVESRRDGTYELALPPGSYRLEVSSDVGASPPDGFRIHVETAPMAQDLVLMETGRIDGHVFDADGRPVPNVEIKVDGSSGYRITDMNGEFHIEDLPVGEREVTAEPSDAAVQIAQVVVNAHATTAVKFTVESRHGEIRGVVTGTDGQPARDTFVSVSRELDGDGVAYVDHERVLVGSDGAFSVAGIPEGTYSVRASDGRNETFVEHVHSGATVHIQLHASGSISGVVRRGADRARDVQIKLENRANSWQRTERFYMTEGRYRIADVPAGAYTLTVTDGQADVLATTDVSGGHDVQVDVDLDHCARTSGRVVDLESGEPVADADVSVIPFRVARRVGKTDAMGRFSIPSVLGEVSDQQLAVDARGYVSYQGWCPEADVNLGEMFIVKKRPLDNDGTIGVRLGGDEHRVYDIDPTGPAANRGLVEDDLVTMINGVDVHGVDMRMVDELLRLPVGATVQLGLARGVTVTITAESSRR